MIEVPLDRNSLTKTAAAGWNAGAISTKSIPSGDGYMEFTAVEATTARMAGLGVNDTNQSYADIEFAIYLKADGTIQVRESGTNRGGFGTYAAGDRFRVGVESGVVKYYKNGSLLYTSALAPTYPLRVDTSLYSTGATVGSVAISGN